MAENQPLLTDLFGTREQLLAAAEALSPEVRDVPFIGHWDVHALVAHLIGWDEANIAAIAELARGVQPGFYAHHGPDWADYNATLVARYRRNELVELIAAARASQARLLAAAGALPPGDFDRDYGGRFKGWKVTIARLLRAEQRDEAEHLGPVRGFAAQLTDKR